METRSQTQVRIEANNSRMDELIAGQKSEAGA